MNTYADNVSGFHEFLGIHLVCIVQNHGGASREIRLVEGFSADFEMLGGDLFQKNGVAFAVLDIAAEVGDTARVTSLLEVIVEPSQKNLLEYE